MQSTTNGGKCCETIRLGEGVGEEIRQFFYVRYTGRALLICSYKKVMGVSHVDIRSFFSIPTDSLSFSAPKPWQSPSKWQ